MLTPGDNEMLAQARAAMRPLLHSWMEQSEVLAIYVLSSSAVSPSNLTRFDEESDFDVSLVLDIPMRVTEWRPHPAETYALLADRIPAWVPPFLFHVQVPWGRMEVNVHQLIFQYESDPRTVWKGEKCEVYLAKSEQLMDRDGSFHRLIQDKVEAGRSRLALERDRLANRITWDVREMSRRQARRLGPAAGHYLFNMALDEVVDFVYVDAGIFVPNKKWKIGQLVPRGLLTPEQETLLREAMRCDLTAADLERRIRALESLCASVGIVTSGSVAEMIRRRFQQRLQLRGARCSAPSLAVDA